MSLSIDNLPRDTIETWDMAREQLRSLEPHHSSVVCQRSCQEFLRTIEKLLDLTAAPDFAKSSVKRLERCGRVGKFR